MVFKKTGVIDTPHKLKELKKWIKALRSGKYSQGIGSLQTYRGYCCLGVGCVVLGDKSKLSYYTASYGETLVGGMPNAQGRAVPKWLSWINIEVMRTFGYSLSQLNDHYKYTFDEIADILEAIYVHRVLPIDYHRKTDYA